jgi:membrane fusion protein, copper/silver efflux system
MEMSGKMCSDKMKKMETKKTKKMAVMNYSCPMHPEVTSDKPGKCPKCGMDLVKKT